MASQTVSGGEKEAETDRQTERLKKLPDRQEAARAG